MEFEARKKVACTTPTPLLSSVGRPYRDFYDNSKAARELDFDPDSVTNVLYRFAAVSTTEALETTGRKDSSPAHFVTEVESTG
jgi:hypothetical protein